MICIDSYRLKSSSGYLFFNKPDFILRNGILRVNAIAVASNALETLWCPRNFKEIGILFNGVCSVKNVPFLLYTILLAKKLLFFYRKLQYFLIKNVCSFSILTNDCYFDSL